MVLNPTGLREIAHSIFMQTLAECSVEQAFAREVKTVMDENGSRLLLVGDDVIDLDRISHIRIVAVGKAASAMLGALLPHLQNNPKFDLAGVLIAKDKPSHLPPQFQFFSGAHPLPDEQSIAGARAALNLVRSPPQNNAKPENTLSLFLISGGASAMMELPLDASISLADIGIFYRELVHSGASIAEINCVRKHFSAVKGGRLAMAAQGSLILSLLVSDVPSGHLDALGSGPTLPDTSTVDQCRDILSRHHLLDRFPASVRRFFLSSELEETPKPADLDVRAVTLLSEDDMAAIARRRAEELGFYAIVDNTCDDWDYRAAAEYLLERLRTLREGHSRVCIISSGEVTVELPGPRSDGSHEGVIPGTGGRNQQFVLYAATLLEPSDKSTAIFSAGSDGIDGNSSAAGAVVDEQTLSGASETFQMRDETNTPLTRAKQSLKRFDAGTFLESIGATIVTGATGNNLRDLRILLAEVE
jgi:glycerate 2-kinase